MDVVTNWFAQAFGFVNSMYEGLPLWAIPMFWLAFVMIVLSLVFLVILVFKAQRQFNRAKRDQDKDVDPAEHESDFLWVFMVPALNEAVTIADSVERLTQVEVTHSRILVINDGSDDDTGDILMGLSRNYDRLTVLTRVAPNARQGKSEALNDAWRFLHNEVLKKGRYKGWDPQNVIVTIVDADGRLDRTAGRVAKHFHDERVGGVQSQVRIYNRHSLLTVAQDMEFGVFGAVFQLGRTGWGTANMGGNGQFNRLTALDSVATEDSEGRVGPWKSGRLTEDQDIGLRMIHQGWRGEQSVDVAINQQGLNSLRALMRQRTRWSQGTWQVFDMIWPSLKNKNISLGAKLDQFWYLLTPLIQAWLGFVLVLSLVFLGFRVVTPSWSWLFVIILYMFAAVPSIVGVLFTRRRPGILGFFITVAFAHLYLIYAWIIYPVVYRALFRQVTGARTWAKTAREKIVDDSDQESTTDSLAQQSAAQPVELPALTAEATQDALTTLPSLPQPAPRLSFEELSAAAVASSLVQSPEDAVIVAQPPQQSRFADARFTNGGSAQNSATPTTDAYSAKPAGSSEQIGSEQKGSDQTGSARKGGAHAAD